MDEGESCGRYGVEVAFTFALEIVEAFWRGVIDLITQKLGESRRDDVLLAPKGPNIA